MQILPAIDIRDGKCVRLRQGDYNQETVFSDDPVAMAQHWAEQGARWLHLVDLDGAKAGRPVNSDLVKRIVASIDIPCEIGGGIRDEGGIRLMLEECGVQRAIVGTQALKQPSWFKEMVAAFPGKLALGIDARNSMVATEGWLEVSETPAIELAHRFAGIELAAVIYTNIANDGMMQGIDKETLEDLASLAQLGLPVIASGGVTTLDDVRKLRELNSRHPNVVGAIIGRALYEGTITVSDANAVAENPL